MKTFVLIPGAGGAAWYWHRVSPLLVEAGHEVIAVDLPGDDPNAGLHAYADLVVGAIGPRRNVVLVAQSMGGFTAPLVAARVPIDMLVFVNAMIPLPGETPGAWWGNTGSSEARKAAAARQGYSADFDLDTYFLHDVPKDEAEALAEHEHDEGPAAFAEAAGFAHYPDVPIHVVVGKDDRLFPNDFQARVARERLGEAVTVDEIPGGHLVALSQPRVLADRLLAYVMT